MPTKSNQLLDLLYPESRLERVKEIERYLRVGSPVLPEEIHRVTLFLTFRCNLRCRYCNTVLPNPTNRPWPAKGKTMKLALFKRLVDQLVSHRVQHLHLTGGEATLVKDLPEMVSHATRCGIPCSITTNGTTSPHLFRELVKCGLREIRISCDTHVPEEFDYLVGRKGYYARVADSIRELVRMRDVEGERIHIIVNMCVGYENRERIVEAVKRSASLNPDDIKLIAVSNERLGLGAFENKKRVIDELEEFLAQFPPGQFPLLRRKLATVFTQDTYGLEDLTSKKLIQNCFVPLTERVYDAEYYYPCPVYVREGGAPLGRLDDDDLETQQRKSFEFSSGTSCVTDAICIKSCIYCCKKFNQHANAEIHRRVISVSGEIEPLSVTARYDGSISSDEILNVMNAIEEERKTFLTNVRYIPFLVIKPHGLKRRQRIHEILSEIGVRIKERREVSDWNDVALRLYSYPLSEWSVYRGLLLKRVLPGVEHTTKAEVLLLDGQWSYEDMADVKLKVRSELPPLHCLIFHGEDLMVTTLGYLHSPDSSSYWLEANLLCKEWCLFW